MWEHILDAVVLNLQPSMLFVVAVGTVVGTIVGALPGLSAVSGVALMLPFTFTMEPAPGLVMLAAVYMSAEYGGSISAILINTPGTSGAACTLLDGTPLTKKGQAQEALYTSLLAGTRGGSLRRLVLLFFTPILADLSLFLGPAEIFWVAVAGLSLVASLSGKHIVKGLIGVLLGVALTVVGQDAISGDMRFTFDIYQLVSGIPLVPALLGLFAVASILNLLENPEQSIAPLVMRKGALRFVCEKLMGMKFLLLWTSILGTVVGIIPGAGAAISSFVAYGEAKRISKHPEEFGKGSYEGVVAPECANNAVVGGAMVPLLALGIPGSGSAAVMYGALTVHGILAGPTVVHRARRRGVYLHGGADVHGGGHADLRPGHHPLVKPDGPRLRPVHGAGRPGAVRHRDLRAAEQPGRRVRADRPRDHRLPVQQAGYPPGHDRAGTGSGQSDRAELPAGGDGEHGGHGNPLALLLEASRGRRPDAGGPGGPRLGHPASVSGELLRMSRRRRGPHRHRRSGDG